MKKIFDNSGWFAIDNAVFDVIMPALSPNAFKVLCVAIRQTCGWSDGNGGRKRADVISYSQFQEKTGIKSRHTISDAITECLDAGFLLRHEAGRTPGTGKATYAYSLNTDYALDPSAENALASAENALGASAENALTKRNKKKQQTTTRAETETRDGESNHETSAGGVAVASLNNEQQAALDALVEIGFTPERDARRYAMRDPARAAAWAEYARAEGLGGGFVRKRLDAGDDAPQARRASPPIPENTEVFV